MIITGTSLLLTDDGGGFTGVAPDAPTNFNATDAESCQITFTWTDSTVGNPTPTYNLYIDGEVTPIAENITSSHVISGDYFTTNDWYVKAINSVLPQGIDSNIDAGVAIDTRPTAFTINGTTDEILQITFTWTEEANCTFDLYEVPLSGGQYLRGSDITSPHVYSVNPDPLNRYYIRATNGCGVTDSTLSGYLYSTEVPTLPNVITTGDYIYMTVLSESNYSLTRTNWHVLVGGVEDTSGSVYKLSGAGETLRIGPLQTIYTGETVTVTHDVQEITFAPFTNLAVTNNSTIVENAPPVYLMTEALITVATYQYLNNSSSSGEIYNGRLEHSALSNDELEGTPWWPSNAAYPDDPLPAQGWIDLNVNGNATRQINTQWIPPLGSSWSISAIYDVDYGTSYKIYALDYHGDETVDVWLGQNINGSETPIERVARNLDYTPPTTAWVIQETPPDIINITIDEIIYEMDSFITV